MFDLYYDATPNGRKIVMALEEMDLDYRLIWVRLDRGDQFSPHYRELSPSSKMPALVHHQNGGETPLFESGAILFYLSQVSGKLLSQQVQQRASILSWLFWQTSTFGPAVGQATHFHSYAAASGHSDWYASERFANIVEALYADLNRHLESRAFVSGELSIADLAIFPWVRVAKGHGVDVKKFPNILRWSESIARRPSAQVKPVPSDRNTPFETYDAGDLATWDTLFSNRQGKL